MMIPLSTKFRNNTLIKYFDELVYFTEVTSTGVGSAGCFQDSSIIKINSNHVTSGGYMAFSGCRHLVYAFFPLLTTFGAWNFRTCTSLKYVKVGHLSKRNTDTLIFEKTPLVYVAIYFISMPTWINDGTMGNFFPNNPYIYVPDDFLDELKSSTYFSARAAKMRPLSELERDALDNGWDY